MKHLAVGDLGRPTNQIDRNASLVAVAYNIAANLSVRKN